MTQPRTNTASCLLRFSGLTTTFHLPGTSTKSPFTWLEYCWLIGRLLSRMVVRYVTAHCDRHCVPDVCCWMVVKDKTFKPIWFFPLALKSRFSKAESLSRVSLVKISRVIVQIPVIDWRVNTRLVQIFAKVESVSENLLSRMLYKWITWRRGRGLQKRVLIVFYFQVKRERKENKENNRSSHMSPPILHSPFLSSLFMKHTQDCDKNSGETCRKWKELVQDWRQGEVFFSGSRSDIKSLPCCISAGRRSGPVRWR